jgi:hypothetical protein
MKARRPATVLGALALSISVLAASPAPAPAATANPQAVLTFTLKWSRTTSGQIVLSSPNVANLDGAKAVVVGDRLGRVLAYHLADGSAVAGWPVSVGAPVDSTPSVAAIGTGGRDVVFVGSGNAAHPTVGGYNAINPNGTHRWFVQETNPSSDPTPHNGVQASMSVGTLQGITAVVGPSLGQNEYVMSASSGNVLAGFPWFQADSTFTTPAIADVQGTGENMIVEGGSQSAGLAYGRTYKQGGHLRVLSQKGNYLTGNPAGGLLCDYENDQVVESSPAVGYLGGTSTVGAVFGTGTYWPGASTTNHVLAVNAATCHVMWNHALDGATNASPALANILGTGALHAVAGTNDHQGHGSVWAFNGATGATLWKVPATGAVIGGPVTADLRNLGRQDVIVSTTNGVDVFDGKTGASLGVLPGTQYEAFQNTALVTRDPDGHIGITVAGYNHLAQGVIQHYEVSGPTVSTVNGPGWWPSFHHDPQLTGNAGTPPPIEGIARKGTGYWLTQSNSGVFTCAASTCTGPTGARQLNSTVVDIESNPKNTGYWTVAGDGGVFAAGTAPFKGSMGGKHLNQPIVGMAPTPTGNGYWLVALDGGVFTFGDAPYKGSMGGKHLNAFIVGMASTPSGQGYWLVASDGGIFSFGDAGFYGSLGGTKLAQPILDMTRTPSGHGYWLVAADGGVFTFGTAGFHGSAASSHPSRPVIGIEATSTGQGYWLVTTGGKVYNYGDATFHGAAT